MKETKIRVAIDYKVIREIKLIQKGCIVIVWTIYLLAFHVVISCFSFKRFSDELPKT